MENVRAAFDTLPDEKSVPIGHQFVQCHIEFDVKIKDLICEARLVARGLMTATVTYESLRLWSRL